jgi:hypothetical protein
MFQQGSNEDLKLPTTLTPCCLNAEPIQGPKVGLLRAKGVPRQTCQNIFGGASLNNDTKKAGKADKLASSENPPIKFDQLHSIYPEEPHPGLTCC